ncbi:hypothetical protein O6P37_01545 [Mycobacterium sp. CPCC 205372]|uniref:Uncharacterized protein n=1 Tax=Mycobacterium hippophais TaxID=3016340 RepID=A0ABT4PLV8_9MYCO|nr:hypothetical protein [Mycobacterium hippophais]MCZ8377538.1 hypothetical protein [Mycobacterium hippophais]
MAPRTFIGIARRVNPDEMSLSAGRLSRYRRYADHQRPERTLAEMSKVPSRKARLAHAAKHAELWNAGKNHFGTEPNVQMAHSIETFAWDDYGNLLIKTYYPMPESVDGDADPYAHLLEGQK